MTNPTVLPALIGTGVKTITEVLNVWGEINPPQEGYLTVINSSTEMVTVRSYNNNDFLMFIAAMQINLRPGERAMITARSNPIKLVWKSGNYGTLAPFGTRNLNQSAAPKNSFFVIG